MAVYQCFFYRMGMTTQTWDLQLKRLWQHSHMLFFILREMGLKIQKDSIKLNLFFLQNS